MIRPSAQYPGLDPRLFSGKQLALRYQPLSWRGSGDSARPREFLTTSLLPDEGAATYPNAKDLSSPLDIRPVGGRIGAEIHGVTLSGDLDAATVQAIEAAVIRHKVVFFRGQTHLDNAGHEAFASLLGDPVAHPTVPVAEGSKYLLQLGSQKGHAASSWHTD